MGNARNRNVAATRARSSVYGLLATVFLAEPDCHLIRGLKGPELLDAFADLGVDLGEDFSSLSESDLKERLSIEFTRLFLGPGTHVSAHESVFAEVDGDSGELWGAKTVEVKKFIESTGLVYDDGFSGLPDHISVELEFMGRLIDWEGDKHAERDDKGAAYCLRIQKKFFEEHLIVWVPALCAQIIEHAELAFYRDMAAMMRDFLHYDYECVKAALGEDDNKVSVAAGL